MADLRKLRREQTDSESILWGRLRAKRLDGFKFRRQHRIGPFIVDFVCLRKRLVVEVEGGAHLGQEQREYDARRRNWLATAGFKVLRVWNGEVYNDVDAVVERVRRALMRARWKDEVIGFGCSPLSHLSLGGWAGPVSPQGKTIVASSMLDVPVRWVTRVAWAARP